MKDKRCYADEPTPCETCIHTAKCLTGKSCKAFMRFYNHRVWRKEDRIPDSKLFTKMWQDVA